MVEIFNNRIEITNPGTPLIPINRFIDGYVSRNELLAGIMRRMGICEEKGSGFDKIITYNELYQLPPISIETNHNKTKVTIYSHKALNQLEKIEKIMACYQHACLKYASREKMTNLSFRKRFNIEDKSCSSFDLLLHYTFLKTGFDIILQLFFIFLAIISKHKIKLM